jgi:hypothetical protein
MFWLFGVFVLNALKHSNDAQCPDLARFPVDVCLYAMALQCYIAGEEIEPLRLFISSEDFIILDRFYRAVGIDEAIPSFMADWDLYAEKFPLLKQVVSLGFGQRQTIAAYDRLLEFDPGNKYDLNNRGYIVCCFSENMKMLSGILTRQLTRTRSGHFRSITVDSAI